MELAVLCPRFELTSGLHGFAVQALFFHVFNCAAGSAGVVPSVKGPGVVDVQRRKVVCRFEPEDLSKEGEFRLVRAHIRL